MQTKSVLLEKRDSGIAVLTLNRPQAANALSLQLLYELHEAIFDIKFDRSVRCVIVTGAGDRSFCAGADLKERAAMDPTQVRKTLSLIRNNINELELLPQPVIAAVNGVAFGGGTELALACDIRIASEQAKFGLTETSLAIGLVEYVMPGGELIAKSLQIAEQIARNAPIAVAQAKFAVDRGYDVDLHSGLAIEGSAYELTIPTKDRLEGLQAFREKRPPVYRGE
ncbi:enoyl-CoA hydratase-related protein [Effusibacillus dendaii]|uniref:Putative enoyl-CoA hydratase/isomerase YngF n=1 Tax=Effusibacillus dendaii TaxID=2743772 RepID=A0A7I8D9V3_9BACL|nr:enoyl-CoA hydratase-related protein [Effusibacillus dendaii]BCJ86142.1 putative enoyl-CoA hydratase/isomerase YngF [Effusibacillus dendaii]